MKSNKKRKATSIANARRSGMRGVSLVEILIVLLILGIMTAVSLPYLVHFQRRYKSEDQALKIIDFMARANQYALTRRRYTRLEIDLTDNKAIIIDENGAGAADDKEIHSLRLEPTGELRVDQIPTGVSKPNPPDYNDATYATDTVGHKSGNTTVNGHNVWAIRFRSDGAVVNQNGIVTSANLYVWQPLTAGSTTPKDVRQVRAITIFGGSGAVRYWKHNGTNFVAY